MRLEEARAKIVRCLYLRAWRDFSSSLNNPRLRGVIAGYYRYSGHPRHINLALFSGEEREFARVLNHLLPLLFHDCNQFKAALALLEHSRTQREYFASWGAI